jgi:acetyl esterase/lipase
MRLSPSAFTPMNRHEFLKLLAGGAVAAALPRCAFAQRTAVETHIYKVADGCQIKADVYGAREGDSPILAETKIGTVSRKPAVLWIHGGALIMGSRASRDARFQAELVKRGFVVVSIDYRLAPETKLPEIIADVRDAWRWLRREGGKQFGIDTDRMAVAGGSAGGYLTLMTGFCLEPRPRALVSYYGYGDITTPWYTQPDEFYRRQPLVPKEEAYRVVGGGAVSEPPASNQRRRFYLYCRQNGIWPKEVSGHDPQTEPKWFDAYCPIRNVTAEYPPTFLIHGTADTDVPYAESKNMAARLAAAGIKHEFITVDGAGHGLAGAAPDKLAEIARQAAEFINIHTH